MLPINFKAAIWKAFSRTIPYWIVIVLWEMLKDRISGLANQWIDDNWRDAIDWLIPIINNIAVAPLGYTVAVAIGIFILIFIHAYYTEPRNKSVENSEKNNQAHAYDGPVKAQILADRFAEVNNLARKQSEPLKTSNPNFEQEFNLRLDDDQSFIPLSDAARKLYEELRYFDKNHKQIEMAESFRESDVSENGVLEYFVRVITLHGEILGKRPPSSIYEVIQRGEINRAGKEFRNNFSELFFHNRNVPEFVDLVVESETIPTVLDWLKQHDIYG